MSDAAVTADRAVRRVLGAQAVVLAAAAAGVALVHGAAAALALLYGGAITLVATGWTARSIRRSAALAARDGRQAARVLYGGLMRKYTLVLAALALGMAVLGTKALAMLAGFAVTHLGYLADAACAVAARLARRQGPCRFQTGLRDPNK